MLTGDPVARLCQGDNGAAQFQELFFGLAHQRYKDFALPTPLASKSIHNILKGFIECVGVGFQCGRWRGALRRDGLDEVEDFF
jgi:hypothetical protein